MQHPHTAHPSYTPNALCQLCSPLEHSNPPSQGSGKYVEGAWPKLLRLPGGCLLLEGCGLTAWASLHALASKNKRQLNQESPLGWNLIPGSITGTGCIQHSASQQNKAFAGVAFAPEAVHGLPAPCFPQLLSDGGEVWGSPLGSSLSLTELCQSVHSSRGVQLGAGQVLAPSVAAGSRGPVGAVFVIQLHG